MEVLSSFGEKEFFHAIEGLSVAGVGGNEVTFVEQGIEAGVEETTNIRGFGGIKYGLVKVPILPLCRLPLNLDTPMDGLCLNNSLTKYEKWNIMTPGNP